MSIKIIYKIFIDAVRSAHSQNLIPKYIQSDEGSITIAGKSIQKKSIGKLIVIACGKASAAMAHETVDILGDITRDGVCVTKYGHALPLKKIEIIEAAHPYPDQRSIKAGSIILDKISSLGENDFVLLLLSGGASSLMADAPDGCTIEDIQQLNKLLVNSGATINEINIVRKHVSKLKGGHLSKLIYPAAVFSLIISDVPGNNLEDIASGLTVADPSTYENAFLILQKYSLISTIPISVFQHLNRGRKGLIEETPKPGSKYFSKTFNTIIASNQTALDAAAVSAKKAGFQVIQITEFLQGDTMQTARQISDFLLEYNGNFPVCFLWGGETTIRVSGKGFGGRNQHLALCILHELKEKWNRTESFTILCAGTDGTDGPTDAAGAIINSEMLEQKDFTNESIESCLNEFNSYTFFKRHGGLIFTGPTQTNVMDVMIAILDTNV